MGWASSREKPLASFPDEVQCTEVPSAPFALHGALTSSADEAGACNSLCPELSVMVKSKETIRQHCDARVGDSVEFPRSIRQYCDAKVGDSVEFPRFMRHTAPSKYCDSAVNTSVEFKE